MKQAFTLAVLTVCVLFLNPVHTVGVARFSFPRIDLYASSDEGR